MFIDQAIKVLGGRKLVLADHSAKYRSQIARYLRSIGLEVAEANNAQEACDLLTVMSPDLVSIDIDLPGDVRRCILEAGEMPGSNGSAHVLLTCRPRTPREKLLAAITPAVGAAVVTPCRPELMIEKLALLVAPPKSENPIDNPISIVPGNNSLLLQQVLCPFHEQHVPTRRFSLRMNRVESEPNFFDVPVYTHAIGQADYVNYNQLCVTACPECLFASADPSHFMASGRRGHAPSTFSPSARYAINSKIHQRKEILGGEAPESFFSEGRTSEQAIKSFELALHCSLSLHSSSPRQYAQEPIRQGNYHLRIALLQEQLGKPVSARDAHIERAAEILKDAFPSLSEADIPRSVYQVVATSIYMGNDKDAHTYLGQLARFSRTARDPMLKQSMDRYLYRSAKAWENREYHRRKPDVVQPMAPFLTTVPSAVAA